MRHRGVAFALATLALATLVLAACAQSVSPGPSSDAAHDAQADRVRSALETEMGMTFEPAGPHHVLGKAPDGVELDLVGVPVEAVVLSVPSADPEGGLVYLPHIRDLLHGPDRVYDWVAAMLACRTDASRACEATVEQGNLSAEFTSEGPEFVVLSISRVGPADR
jgi:hypothetical protein